MNNEIKVVATEWDSNVEGVFNADLTVDGVEFLVALMANDEGELDIWGESDRCWTTEPEMVPEDGRDDFIGAVLDAVRTAAAQ